MLERFYQKLEKEALRPYVLWVLAGIAFLESIIFPIPIDIFTFGLAAVAPKKWLSFASVGTIFSVLGAIAGYALGYYLFDSFGIGLIEFYGYQEQFEYVKTLYNNNVFWVVFAAAFTPIPYKVFTLTGGVVKAALAPFLVASLLGRGIRFYLECYLAYRFGKKITGHIMHKVNTYSLIFVAVVVIYFIIKLF